MAMLAPEGLIEFVPAGQIGVDDEDRLAWFSDGKLYVVSSVVLFARGKVRLEGHLPQPESWGQHQLRRRPPRASMTLAVDEVVPTVRI